MFMIRFLQLVFDNHGIAIIVLGYDIGLIGANKHLRVLDFQINSDLFGKDLNIQIAG